MSTELATKKPENPVVATLLLMKPAIKAALPKHVDPDRMARIALTAVRTNPKLAECSPESFLGAMLQAAQLGLEPNTPLQQCFLIPRWNSKLGRNECSLQIGYQGFIQLAFNSGLVEDIYAYPVHAGDLFEYSLGLHRTLEHKPARGSQRTDELTDVYAVARLKGGSVTFVVLDIEEVEQARRRSQSPDSGPWKTDYEAMALKTAVRRLQKWIPKSAEQARAATIDSAADREESVIETFSTEVNELVATAELPPPQTIVDTAPEGKRVKVDTGRRPMSAVQAEAHRAQQAPPPEPPAAPARINREALWELLKKVDEAWQPEITQQFLVKWNDKQALEAHTWAHAVVNDGPMALQSKRPEHTRLGKSPEGEWK